MGNINVGDKIVIQGTGVEAVVHFVQDDIFLADTHFGEYGYDKKHVPHSFNIEDDNFKKVPGTDVVLAIRKNIFYALRDLDNCVHNEVDEKTILSNYIYNTRMINEIGDRSRR